MADIRQRSAVLVRTVSAFVAITCGARASADPLYWVDSWSLGSRVSQNGSGGQVSSERSFVAQNPWIATTTANIGASIAQTVYDLHWNNNGGVFHFEVQATALDSNPGFISSDNSFLRVRPQTPMKLHIQSSYSYFLPGVLTAVDFNTYVSDDMGNTIGGRGFGDDSFFGDTSGMFRIDGIDVFLTEPGHLYNVSFLARILSLNGGSNRLATGSGTIDLTFSLLPSPGSAALLVAAAPLAIMRRQRRPS